MKDGESEETVSVSLFKATCLARLERVRRTGRGLLVTKRGRPIAQVVPAPAAGVRNPWLGSAAQSGRLLGDLVAPVGADGEWEVRR